MTECNTQPTPEDKEKMEEALAKREAKEAKKTEPRELDKATIDNFREAMGTLPGRNKKTYEYMSAYDPRATNVRMIDATQNPYKTMVAAATATWGSGQVGYGEGSMGKWEKLTPEARFVVVISVLTGNTLPQAAEPVNFQFEMNGIPRHTFDQYARMRIGGAVQSIGCRDNSKLDAPLVLYPNLYEAIQNDPEFKEKFEEYNKTMKDMYEYILNRGDGSYQEARAVLPMSYNHSFVTNINYLALKSQAARRLMFCEESTIQWMFTKMRQEVEDRFPLLANYIRPVCDVVAGGKCVYSGGAEGLTKYFSNLYRGCGRHEDPHSYAEFNRSCTDVEEFNKVSKEQGYHLPEPDEWIDFTEFDYDKLDPKDKALFEED